MLNNDILRRLRYALNLNDKMMLSIFELAGHKISRDELLAFLKKPDDEDFVSLNNQTLSLFLDGLITHKRGKLENPPEKPVVIELDNNQILRKLRIALAFRDEDMLNTLQLADFKLSKNELSAFFRPKTHQHYRKCGDQVLRNFLQGLTLRFRTPSSSDS